MEFLVCRSRALVAPGTAEADEIVATSVRNNAHDRLTGFLHHEPHLFLQYIEGPASQLEATWRRILADPRHQGATIIGGGLAAHRLFDGWCLGCSDHRTARLLDFLDGAAGKTVAEQMTAREATWFLRGACQRLDLGLTA